MNSGSVYEIYFVCDGYHSKYITIDTRNIPEEALLDGFDIVASGKLFPFMAEFNLELLRQPVAIMKYEDASKGIVVDEDYSSTRIEMLQEELMRIKKFEDQKEHCRHSVCT
ncbi:MAG: hypothetical protein IPP69_05615 [Flavobacteriales bacterium]|nr:hypothetical protein [Flavobacteriales bacterium]